LDFRWLLIDLWGAKNQHWAFDHLYVDECTVRTICTQSVMVDVD